MARLPVVSGRETVRVFESFGWQMPGNPPAISSWLRMGIERRFPYQIIVKWARGTLRSLIRLSGLTVDDFIAAAKS